MHGKPVESLTHLFRGLIDPPEVMCLQEVGGFTHLQQGQTITNDVRIGDVEYVVYVHNTFRAHLATAVAVQVDLEPARPVFFCPCGRFFGGTIFRG